MERIVEQRSLKEMGARKLSAVLLAGCFALAACGDDGDEARPKSSNQAPAATSEDTATREEQAPFRVTREWSLPVREPLSPRIMTAELCEQGFWEDKDGKRRPPVQEDPLIIRVDGRCNTPLEVEKNGVYNSPRQQGKAPIVVVNGDALGVECYTTGEPIQDIRGPRSSSDVWLGVVTADGKQGLFPETNAGYVDESKLDPC